jgi:hypothetical protein
MTTPTPTRATPGGFQEVRNAKGGARSHLMFTTILHSTSENTGFLSAQEELVCGPKRIPIATHRGQRCLAVPGIR